MEYLLPFFVFALLLLPLFSDANKKDILNLTNLYIHKVKTNTEEDRFSENVKGLHKLLFLKGNKPISYSAGNIFKLSARVARIVKPKTNKSIAKRFKITKNGKLIRKKAGRSHMLRKKTSSNKSALRQRTQIGSNRIAKKYKSVIFK